ncbi:molecular chaperone DnaJ [Nocardia sp. SYP-A9097]|uniref:molecular chaperone DnaJ n=1 Tax=Nocardia sp. SYP-A9097 TaxID=2663237 RepID=UPI00132B90B9|nr:molecular chaperone DnaJ [Nocardia sp. SYP-A9097]MRH89545.1 molecular chaperone DnaJ [Nocardia sp. SYP-A9097]
MARDYYALLGVARNATDQEIKRAYRKLARELHPDVNPEPEAQERFREVSTAYEVLTDAEKRRIVDLGGDPMESGGGAGGFSGAGFGGLGDVFEAFFGGMNTSNPRKPRGRVQPGADSLLRTRLSLQECAVGVTKHLTVDTAILCDVCVGSGTNGNSKPVRCETCGGAGEVQTVQRSFLGQVMTSRPCPTCRGAGETIPDPCHKCGGDGRVRSRREIAAPIPAGVASGMRVRLAAQGEVGPGGGPAGDLYVEIVEQPHDTFVRDSDDLHCTIRVPMVDATLGTTVVIDTILDGPVELTIPQGTQPGEVSVLRGHGMPKLRANSRGDLIAHLDIVIPTKMDSKQSDLLRKYKAMRPNERTEVLSTQSEHNSGLFARLRASFSGR